MKAVLKYADEMGNYLKDHPVEMSPTSFLKSSTPEGHQTPRDQRTEQPLD